MLFAFVLAIVVGGDARADPPKADQAHGIATRARRTKTRLLAIPRTILYIPRRTVELALSPIRLALWAYERYELERLYYRVFFFDARRFGFYPDARLTSGFGVSGGMRLVHEDLFRNGGDLDAVGMYGRDYGSRLALDVDSGWLRASRVRVGGKVEVRHVPGERFFGIGNADLRPVDEAEALDPLRTDTAVDTRFTHRWLRVGPIATIRVAAPLDLELSTTYAHRDFGPPTRARGRPGTATVFDPRRLVGYESGVDNIYGQVRFVVDTRHRSHRTAMTSRGWYGALYGGYTIGVSGDPSRFGRLGLDVERFIDLWGGNRVLVLRGVVDTAIGAMSRIPFVDLPTIGGPNSLRGHARDRFRDRIAAYATAEYVYEIDHRLAGFLFVDTGRVWSALNDTSPGELRLGYGGGVRLGKAGRYIARLQIASSIEGGIHVDLNFSPPDVLRDPR